MAEGSDGDFREVVRKRPIPDKLIRDIGDQDVELTPQEKKLIEYFAHGLTHKMVSEAMSISPSTVKTCLDSVRIKLRAKNTTHACVIALREGIIN